MGGRESRTDSMATLSQMNEDPTKFLKTNSIQGSQMVMTQGHNQGNQLRFMNDPSVASEDSDVQRKRMRAMLERDF